MSENAILESLYARRSVRAFTQQEVSAQDRAAILKAAMQAPTAGCQMLYTIIDVREQPRKDQLAELCDHQPFIATAPLVLVFTADCKRWLDAFAAAGCAPRRPGPGDLLLAVADACIAAQNAVVAAESLGLGSCYIGDVLERCEEMRALLALPRYVVPAAMLVIGHPAPGQLEREKPGRFAEDVIVHEDVYRPVSAQRFAAAQAQRSPEGSLGRTDYDTWIRKFCERKYNSDFSREMSRSAEVYLRDFLPWSADEQ